MSRRIRGDLGEGAPIEGCDPGGDMPDTLSGAIWRQQIARSALPGDQIGIDGIGGCCYGSLHHRRPVNQGASSLKWEMSVISVTEGDVIYDFVPTKVESSNPRSIGHLSDYLLRETEIPGTRSIWIMEKDSTIA